MAIPDPLTLSLVLLVYGIIPCVMTGIIAAALTGIVTWRWQPAVIAFRLGAMFGPILTLLVWLVMVARGHLGAHQ
jgi:hypothetical protein